MKKILSIGLLTVCALTITERPAQAWVNSKFSVGLNWHLQSGNNSILWGAWKDGQVPGPEAFQHGPMHHGPHMPPAGVFPYFGQAPTNMPMPNATPTVAPQQQTYYYYSAPYQWNQNPYQTVSYQPNGYYYPSYFYPTYYNAYTYQVPSYWYQGR